jgi:hypothetical protein
MSLYLLLAIAFGALTGVADVPASARPALAGVVARGETRAARRAIRARGALLYRVRGLRAAKPLFASCLRRLDAPLTGAASPRAPSHSC